MASETENNLSIREDVTDMVLGYCDIPTHDRFVGPHGDTLSFFCVALCFRQRGTLPRLFSRSVSHLAYYGGTYDCNQSGPNWVTYRNTFLLLASIIRRESTREENAGFFSR